MKLKKLLFILLIYFKVVRSWYIFVVIVMVFCFCILVFFGDGVFFEIFLIFFCCLRVIVLVFGLLFFSSCLVFCRKNKGNVEIFYFVIFRSLVLLWYGYIVKNMDDCIF